ncbi:MAG: amino acid ABC transporter permease [Aerococcaceae bacterium]|nr:amino acid ABC transporter permease [Aerococcaceae bacterium]
MMAQLLQGFQVTLLFFSVTLVVSIPLGLLLAVIASRLHKVGQYALRVYVAIFRGTPLLLQMLFIFFGLPYLGIRLGRYEAAFVTLILNYAAYFVEIFRGGLNAVPRGQFEALQVLSVNPTVGFRRVILPQVWRIVMPSIGNEVITLIKDTSLIYVLGLEELLKVGRSWSNQTASLMPFVYVGVIYLAFTSVTGFVLQKIEQRLSE